MDCVIGSCDSISTVSSSWKLLSVFNGPSVVTGPCGLDKLWVSELEMDLMLIGVCAADGLLCLDWCDSRGVRNDEAARDCELIIELAESVCTFVKRFSSSTRL